MPDVRTYIYIKHIYIYMTNFFRHSTMSVGSLCSPTIIYTRNLKFAQLVTELASLAITVYTMVMRSEILVCRFCPRVEDVCKRA